MDTTLNAISMADKEARLAESIAQEQRRVGAFIRRRVSDPGEAEDILQDVFYEFVEACRLPEPIEEIGAWLFRVARNRIIDRFRKKREEPLPSVPDDDAWLDLDMPDPNGGPEAAYASSVLVSEIMLALDELPKNQRDVFVAHELEGRSFKELAEERGVPVNTLLARKRQAVLHLRARLKPFYDDIET